MGSWERSSGRPYGGKTPQERAAGRHRRLVEAGIKLFGTDGYAATSIETLCRASRVTPRYFYESFASREALLREIYDDIARDALDHVSTVVRSSSGADVEIIISNGVSALFHSMLDAPGVARIFCIEAVGVSPALERRRRQVLHSFATIISNQASIEVDNPALGSGTYDLVALAVVGGIYELIIDWISELITSDIEDIIQEVSAFILDTLSGLTTRRLSQAGIPT